MLPFCFSLGGQTHSEVSQKQKINKKGSWVCVCVLRSDSPELGASTFPLLAVCSLPPFAGRVRSAESWMTATIGSFARLWMPRRPTYRTSGSHLVLTPTLRTGASMAPPVPSVHALPSMPLPTSLALRMLHRCHLKSQPLCPPFSRCWNRSHSSSVSRQRR